MLKLEEDAVVEIKLGESNHNKKIREEAENRAKVTKIAKIKATAYKDIAVKAEKRFGVPWELIIAVKQVETGGRSNTCINSYAGAVGPMQFLPSTWAGYGVDGDGDGKADICNIHDAIHSGANYLAANGASKGDYRNALWHYNHCYHYVNKVLGIAATIGLT